MGRGKQANNFCVLFSSFVVDTDATAMMLDDYPSAAMSTPRWPAGSLQQRNSLSWSSRTSQDPERVIHVVIHAMTHHGKICIRPSTDVRIRFKLYGTDEDRVVFGAWRVEKRVD